MNAKEAMVIRGTYIGKEITITGYQKKEMMKKGTIRDETRLTFVVDLAGKRKRFLKQSLKFRIKMQGKTFDVDGSRLIGRPVDRIKNR